jgi:polysaccharide deacetylase 2 family uncharacterized protein YibQ
LGRGYIAGLFWGALVSASVMAAASLVVEGPGPRSFAPPEVAPQLVAAEADRADLSEEDPAGSDPGATASPPGPVEGEGSGAEAPAPLPAGAGTVEAAAPPDEPAAPDVVDVPSPPDVTAALDAPGAPPASPEPPAPAPVAPSTQPEVAPAPAATPEPELRPAAPPDAQPEAQAPEAAPPEVVVIIDEPSEDAAPTPEATPAPPAGAPPPQPGLRGEVPGVTVLRPGAPSGPARAGAAALETHAEAFENLTGQPLMAIVLIDEGRPGIGAEALADFPHPLTFAVDPGRPDAAERAAAYRAAGHEVAMLLPLPEGATPSDLEVAMAAYEAAVPQAVAAVDAPSGGLRGQAALIEQSLAVLAASGRGLLSLGEGLDPAPRLAERAGVPARAVFRDFDGEGQNATVIRRFLDQAAFRAGQEGGVVVLGRLRAETVSALLIWGLQERAQRVSLAPLSALLLEGGGG